MSWHPPWLLGDRRKWARARPWLAGFYFGLGMAPLVGVYVTVPASVVAGIAGQFVKLYDDLWSSMSDAE